MVQDELNELDIVYKKPTCIARGLLKDFKHLIQRYEVLMRTSAKLQQLRWTNLHFHANSVLNLR